MQALLGLGTLATIGAGTCALVAWLANRQHPAVKTTGIALCAFLAFYCGLVAVAIAADNLSVADRRLVGGTASLIHAVTAVAAAVAVMRVLRPRVDN